MKKVLIIGKHPSNEDEVSFYKQLEAMCEEYDCEIIHSPITAAESAGFEDYADLFGGIEECDLVIAESSDESTAQGMQFKEIDVYSKPIIIITKRDKGNPFIVELLPTVAEVLEYDVVEDLREGLIRNIAVLE